MFHKSINPYISNSLDESSYLILYDGYFIKPKHFPKISVVIPCYEKGEFLEKAFKSCIENQHLTKYQFNIEIICVDDGSTDQTLEIFNRLKKRYESIDILTNQSFPQYDKYPFKNNIHIKIYHFDDNRGSLYAKQFAIKKASGTYIMSLDADDEIIPDFMHRLLLLLDGRNDIDIIQFRLAVVNYTRELQYTNNTTTPNGKYNYKVFTYGKYPFHIMNFINLTTPIENAKYSIASNYIEKSKSNDIDKIDHAVFVGATKLKKMGRKNYMMWNLPGLIIKRDVIVKAIDSIAFNYSSIKISIFEDMLLCYGSYYFSNKTYFLDEVGYIYYKGIKKFKRENYGYIVLKLLRRLYRVKKK